MTNLKKEEDVLEMGNKKNPIARLLRRFKHKRFKDKTKYNRKNFMKKKILGLFATLIILTGCNQLAMLSVIGSTASMVASQNTFYKAYSGVDVLTYVTTNKGIKTHVYDTVTTVKNKVNETFILKKPEMLTKEKRVLVAVPIIKVEVSELFKPDNNLLLASALTYSVEDKIWTTKEWDRYSVLFAVVVVSVSIFLSSLIYLLIYFFNVYTSRNKNKEKKGNKK